MDPVPGNTTRLIMIARDEIDRLIDALPKSVVDHARQVPLSILPRPPDDMDGAQSNLMGLFVGNDLRTGVADGDGFPAQIFIFVENIRAESQESDLSFEQEVRRTYLHELGHYLGLDEHDLFDRGLD